MLTANPNDNSALDPEATTRALFHKMESALEQADVMQFNRLAQERHTLLMKFRDAQGQTLLTTSLLSDLLGENRYWNKKLGEHRARLRAEIELGRSRKNIYRSLAHAYGETAPRSHCVAHHW